MNNTIVNRNCICKMFMV